MTIETSTYIADWNSALPANTDSKSEGDDHIRKIKTDLQATLPGFAGRFRRIQTKSGAYTAVLNDNSSILRTSGTWTLSLTAVSTLGNGWEIIVYNDGSGTITVDPSGAELINGASTLTIAASTWACIWCDGSALRAIGGRTDSINIATTDTMQTFSAVKTFSSNPVITGNALFLRPPNSTDNVHVWLQNETGTNEGLLFWSRSDDKVGLRRYNSAGSAPEGEITIGASGGVMIDAPTGGDKGAGTVNIASDYYKNGAVAFLNTHDQTLLPSASSSQSITLAAGTRYRIEFKLKWNATTAGGLNLRFNSDSGTTYGWSGSLYTATAGPTGINGAGNVGLISLSASTTVPNAGYINGWFEVEPLSDDSTECFVNGRVGFGDTATYLFNGWDFHGRYNGSANITSAQIIAAAGDFTGTVLVYKR